MSLLDKTISDLPAAISLDGTEVFPVDQAGTTKKATFTQTWTGVVNQVVITGPAPQIKLIESDNSNHYYSMLVDNGQLTFRYDGGYPAPLSIDADGRVTIQKPNSAAGDFTVAYIKRTANHVGGVSGNVNNALNVESTVSAGNTNFEWAATLLLDNYSNYADASQNVAAYAKATKRTTGKTWGFVSELNDCNTGTVLTGQAVSAEINLLANDDGLGGGDPGANRVVVDLVAGKRPGGTGVKPTITAALRIGAQDELAGNAAITTGLTFTLATWGTLIGTRMSPTSVNGIDLSGATITGSAFKSSGFQVNGSGWLGVNGATVLVGFQVKTAADRVLRAVDNSNVVQVDATNLAQSGFTQIRVNGSSASLAVQSTDRIFTNGTRTTLSDIVSLPVVANASPADGDVWREDNTNTGLKIRINGVTKTVTVT